MSFVNITDNNEVFVVNSWTGEIVSTVMVRPKKSTPLPNIFSEKGKYIGIETPYPNEILNSEQYFEAVKQIDGLVGNKTKVDTALMIDYVVEGLWSKNDVKIVNFLSTKVVAHNRAFTTIKEISEGTKINKNHVSRWFKESTSICMVLNNRKGFVVDIHPSLVFKGSEEWRELKLKGWFQVPYIK